MTVQTIDRRCITSNDNCENKSLTNTSKSVASISSGALTFIWADGVHATSFLVTTPKYGGILVWDGGKDCTLVNVWRRGQIKQTQQKNQILTPLTRDIQCEKFIFRTRQSVIWRRCRLVKLHQCYTFNKPLFYVLGWNVCHARYEKPQKNHPWVVAKKCVETYSPPNAVVRNSGERILHL